ncbi:MAG: hypothetical protein K8R90_00880 [Candidatus Cloacimonetes bacterium]|nr:hypothetical protein [Candidatus Cloacimonadota bacterium]
MKRLEWLGKIDDLSALPAGAGAFFLRDKDNSLLLADCTTNLPAQLIELLGPMRERTAELRDETAFIEFAATSSLLDAAVAMCKVTAVEQSRLPTSTGHCYLGVRFHQSPYVTVSSFTIEDYYYVGPFTSRFDLHDVIATLSALRQTPACKDDKFPCERLADKLCLGFCVESSISERISYFFRYLLQPNFLLLDELHETREKQMDNLDFAAADLLDRQIRALDAYYDKLCMFHTTHQLNTTIERDSSLIHIENGRLAWVQQEKGRTQILGRPETHEPSAREYLAFDKSQYAERRAVYLALREETPGLVRSLCDNSVQRFAEILKGDTHADS